MAFHINTHDIPALRCYADALLYWQRIKPWRGRGDTNRRPLAGRNKNNMTIRQLNDGSIALELWSTDVVTYHPDGTITLEAYASTSTNMFASRLTPFGISASFGHALGNLVRLSFESGTRTYRMANRTIRLHRVGREWEIVDPATMTEPFRKYQLNTKRASEMRKKYRFGDFEAWCKAMDAMEQPIEHARYHSQDDIPSLLLQGGDGWVALRNMYRFGVVANVRDRLYGMTGCIEAIKLPFTEGFAHENLKASHRRWGSLYYLAND